MNKNFIYFPSLSSGASASWLLKNEYLTETVSSRFYDKEHTPPQFYHPYFLLSAGHNYKEFELRKKYGLEDSFVIGDSGGYQIATGAIKWEKSVRETIFKWLENNSDIALNLDIPPRKEYDGKFQECFDISLDNFKYFEQNQSGKTKFLTVLQGNSLEQYKFWYNAVKDFEFGGLAIGGCMHNLGRLIMVFAMLLEEKELEKKRNNYIHILGMSGLNDFLVIEMIQKFLNKKFGNKLQLSTDSSSPNLATVFGQYYYDVNWDKYSFKSLHIHRELNDEIELACKFHSCPACEGRTYKDFQEWKTKDYMHMTHHNMFVYITAVKQIYSLIDSPKDVLKDLLPNDYYNLYNIIEQIFESDSPLATYKKYVNQIEKVTRLTYAIETTDSKKINNLFKF